MADTEELLVEKIVRWKAGLEAKGLRVNMGKTRACDVKKVLGRISRQVNIRVESVAKESDQTRSSAPHVEHGSISDAVVLLASCARRGNSCAKSAQLVSMCSQVDRQ